ncbi:MAG: hypothetical protein AAFZ15_04990 [Bacteroidota bacterium]
MRQYFTLSFFAFLFIFSQCTSLEYYVEKNKPDAAFRHASRKLNQEKIKTKHLQLLEYGFNISNERDIDRINKLKEKESLSNWKGIHSLNREVLFRHNKIEPYLPLESIEGYRPYFKFYPAKKWEEESFWKVTELYLKEIRNNLLLGTKGKRLKARYANSLIDQLMNNHGYAGKEMDELIDSTLVFGTAYFGLNFFTNSNFREEGEIVRKLLRYNYFFKKDKWRVIEINPDEDMDYDFIVDVEIYDTFVSEDISSSCRRYEKEIEVGKKEIKDTAGNVTYEPIFETVKAEVTTYTLTKDAGIRANITVYSPKDNRIILDKGILGTDSFCEKYCTMSGDSRATSISCSGFCPSFPSDRVMINNSVRPLSKAVLRNLKRIDVLE